jgi:hypothetical protein
LLGCAGTWQESSRRAAAHVGWAVQESLKLTTLANMQAQEEAQILQQAHAAEEQAHQVVMTEQQEEKKAESASSLADRFEHREYYWQHLYEQELHDAKLMEQKAETDATLYSQLAAQVSKDVQQKHHDEDALEMRDVHSGLCGWPGLSAVCGWVGYASTTSSITQEKLDQEQLKIHDEWQKAQEVDQREHMEALAARMMAHQADNYNRTAFYLGMLVDWYEAQKETLYEEAKKDQAKAAELQAQANRFREQAQKDEDWNKHNLEDANALLMRAQRDRQATHDFAVASMMAASMALILALCKALPRMEAWFIAQDVWPWYTWQNTNPVHVGLVGGHLLLLTMAMLTNRWYVSHLGEYSGEKRAVIIFWIALCATCFHFVTWLGVYRNSSVAWRAAGQWFCMWQVLLAMECVAGMIVFGQWRVHPISPAVMISSLLGVMSWTMLATNSVTWVKDMMSWRGRDDDSTMVSESDENSTLTSEIAPLQQYQQQRDVTNTSKAESYSTGATDGMIQWDVGNREIMVINDEIPSYVAWTTQLRRLMLPFEFLLVSVALKYLHSSMAVLVTPSHLLLMEMVLLVVSVLLSLGWTLTRPLNTLDGVVSDKLKSYINFQV